MRFSLMGSIGTLAGCLLGLACATDGFFVCSDDGDCVHAGRGVCQPTGFCSFPDAMCPSGQRYGDQAAGGYAEQCVDEDVAGTGSGTATGTGDSGTVTTTGPLPSTGGSTSATGGTAQTSVGASESASSVTGDDTTSSDSTGSTQTTTNPTAGSTTGSVAVDPYNDCNAQCESLGGTCLESGLGEVCAMPCDRGAPCPDPIGGTATPACTDSNTITPSVCVLPCGGERGGCPPGMQCVADIGLGFPTVCMWD